MWVLMGTCGQSKPEETSDVNEGRACLPLLFLLRYMAPGYILLFLLTLSNFSHKDIEIPTNVS